MKKCLFSGPTLCGEVIAPEIAVFQPAMLGSVFRAVEEGYGRIGIVDGYFGSTPAVWHKEILYAITREVEVVGAASIGALRAAELWQFGMVGVGSVFRLYRRGALQDDDEVCVVHATEEFQYRALSEPMINVRYTLRALRRSGLIDVDAERRLAAAMKAQHFARRTRCALARAAEECLDAKSAAQLCDAFEDNYVDVKRRDALALVQILSEERTLRRAPLRWAFPETSHWVRQFEQDIADVPALRSSGPLW
jgi:hypothetical protein